MTILTQEKYNILGNLHSKMMRKHKKTYSMKDMYALYYEKDGMIFLKAVDKLLIGKSFPDDTQIILYPLVGKERTEYSVMGYRTSLDKIEDEDFEEVVHTVPVDITISKKCGVVFENVM